MHCVSWVDGAERTRSLYRKLNGRGGLGLFPPWGAG